MNYTSFPINCSRLDKIKGGGSFQRTMDGSSTTTLRDGLVLTHRTANKENSNKPPFFPRLRQKRIKIHGTRIYMLRTLPSIFRKSLATPSPLPKQITRRLGLSATGLSVLGRPYRYYRPLYYVTGDIIIRSGSIC